MSENLSEEITVSKGDGIRVVMLLNYLPIHFLSYLAVLSRSLTDLTFLLSETMDAGRDWSPDFGELKVIVQKSIPIRTKHRHPYGFEYKSRMLIPVSTFSDLRRLKPDVVVSLEVGARTLQALLLKCLGMKYRLIVQVRESEISALYRGGLRMRLRKLILPRVDRVLVNGESGRRHVIACGVPPEKISVVASGTDLAVFGRTSKSPTASGCLRVLYVGALIDLKGIVNFARVFADEVSRSEASVEWTLVGRGPERETLEQIAWPANLRVSFIESLEYKELPAMYAMHDVFVMPSLCDEWGMVVNEAMVSRLPVLGCTGSQAIEEMVTPGVNGWTYAPGDEQGMRLAIRELLRLDQRDLMIKGTAAARTAHEFSDERIAGQMLQAIRTTMAVADGLSPRFAKLMDKKMTAPAKHVTFAYVGPLQSRGRLLKQIATLQSAGVVCDVVLGNTLPEAPVPADFPFPVTAIAVDQNSGRLASFRNQLRFCRAAAKIIARGSADTVVCVALEALMAGVLAKRLRPSLRLVFDNNELHIECYGPGVKSLVWKPIHNYGVTKSDVILHAEPNRMEYFKKHYPGSDKPQVVIENFPFLGAAPPERSAPSGEVRVVYLGGFGDDRYTEEIIVSFAKLPPSMKLDIIGFGRPEYLERLRKVISALGVRHVRLLPPVPYSTIPAVLADYHIGVALYRNTDLNNYYCAPNKVYDYLMNGMPVIANRYPGLVSVIETNRVGVCIDEVNERELELAIREIVDNSYWENITGEIRGCYSWEQQTNRYLAVFGH